MLFTKFAAATLALVLPFSVSALSFGRSEALLSNNQYTTSVFEGWSWENCGLSTDPLQIESVEVSPDPPKPGRELTVTVTGNVSEEIEEGAYADVVVKLGLVKLIHKRFDLCEEARKANAMIQCPVSPGSFKITHTVALPREIPQAKFNVAVRGYTVNDDDLVCADIKADFMKRPF